MMFSSLPAEVPAHLLFLQAGFISMQQLQHTTLQLLFSHTLIINNISILVNNGTTGKTATKHAHLQLQ